MKLIIIFYILQALTLCSVLLFYFGILSSMSPNYTWLLILRGLVGFAIGCSPQSYVKIIIIYNNYSAFSKCYFDVFCL